MNFNLDNYYMMEKPSPHDDKFKKPEVDIRFCKRPFGALGCARVYFRREFLVCELRRKNPFHVANLAFPETPSPVLFLIP